MNDAKNIDETDITLYSDNIQQRQRLCQYNWTYHDNSSNKITAVTMKASNSIYRLLQTIIVWFTMIWIHYQIISAVFALANGDNRLIMLSAVLFIKLGRAYQGWH